MVWDRFFPKNTQKKIKMAKVLIYSRQFPAYHQKAGEPTFFAEKFLKSWDESHTMDELMKAPLISHKICDIEVYGNCDPKHHTIRPGNRWKEGEFFSPRIWTGKPYNSKQHKIAPDTKIVKVYDIIIEGISIYINGAILTYRDKIELAENDGLEFQDMYDWFKMPCEFSGQIICWNDKINYSF